MKILKYLFAFSFVFSVFLFSDPARAAVLQSQLIFDEDEIVYENTVLSLNFNGEIDNFVFKATCKNEAGCSISAGDFMIIFYRKNADISTVDYSNENSATTTYAETIDITLLPQGDKQIVRNGDFIYFSNYLTDFTWNGQGGQTDFFLKYETYPSYNPQNASGYFIINGSLASAYDIIECEIPENNDISIINGCKNILTNTGTSTEQIFFEIPAILYFFVFSIIFILIIFLFFFYYK